MAEVSGRQRGAVARPRSPAPGAPGRRRRRRCGSPNCGRDRPAGADHPPAAAGAGAQRVRPPGALPPVRARPAADPARRAAGRRARLLGRPHLAGLVDEVGETANMAMLEGDAVVYVAQVPSPHSMRMFTEVGRRVPGALHRRRQGAAVPAGRPRGAGTGPPTGHAGADRAHITTPDALLAELAEIRAPGLGRRRRGAGARRPLPGRPARRLPQRCRGLGLGAVGPAGTAGRRDRAGGEAGRREDRRSRDAAPEPAAGWTRNRRNC